MYKGETIAASFLAVGFVVVSFVLLVVEPRMGFEGPADFFDPAKVLVGAESAAWLVGDLAFLGLGAALAYLSVSAEDHGVRAVGWTAAVGFVFVACTGRVLSALPTFIAESNQLEVAVLGLLPTRLAALRATVLALGFFAWSRSLLGPSASGVGRPGDTDEAAGYGKPTRRTRSWKRGSVRRLAQWCSIFRNNRWGWRSA